MSSGILAEENTCSADAADGRGDKSVFEQDPILCQRIHIGRFDDRVAHAAHGIPALVIS